MIDAEAYFNQKKDETDQELAEKFEETRQFISEENEKTRSDALARAKLYADDMQVEICAELENKIIGM